MDRKITKEEKRSARRKIIIRIAAAAVCAGVVIVFLVKMFGASVKSNDLIIAKATRGTLESSVNATGKVVPAYEEIITSPVTARIIEVYCTAGDTVAAGTPLLRLDLKSEESAINSLRDTRQKQVLAVEQQRLSNETRLTQIEMEIKVKEMSVSQLAAEVDNERRLDSIGSGTGDRIRQAELAYNTACIELEQLRRQLENERQALSATLDNQRLDLSIADRNLAEKLRTVEDARLIAPRAATLTYINKNIGTQVAQGERIAMLADLTSFKIDADIAESNARYLTNGGRAKIKIGNDVFDGTVMDVAPLSNGGAVRFSVIPDNDAKEKMRPGLSVGVYVIREEHPGAILIPFASYYSNGPGEYPMYVEETPGVIVRRKVMLGGASHNFVEVTDGLKEGEKIVISSPKLTANKYNIR